ncbi:MAG TPA: hypothetical protein ENI06_08405 [Spirochaetales bacterium]|nr:hypothetical protein [Spirochaetales bacterium]
MKKSIIITALVFLLTAPLFSQLQAVIKEVSGKVEIKAPAKGWESATEGMEISKGTIISTGFKSQALLDLGSSILYVKQLTRMSLDELTQQKGIVTTGLFLRVGKVRAQVKTTAGLQHNFTLKSPISTAAVRGTALEYTGPKLKVYGDGESAVILTNLFNQSRTVRGGESSETSGSSRPENTEGSRRKDSSVNPFTSDSGSITSGSETPTTTITINWEW